MIVSVETAPVPVVPAAEIATIDPLHHSDDGITLVTARFGYMQRTDIPAILAALSADRLEAPLDVDDASYFLSTIDLQAGDDPVMPRWRTQLFLALTSLTADAARAFDLPLDRTVVVGSRITV